MAFIQQGLQSKDVATCSACLKFVVAVTQQSQSVVDFMLGNIDFTSFFLKTPKNSWNEINQFHEFYFWIFSIQSVRKWKISKKKSVKLIFLISRVFLAWPFFSFFWLTMCAVYFNFTSIFFQNFHRNILISHNFVLIFKIQQSLG